MDIKSLEKIFELFNKSQATEFELEVEEFKIKLKREYEFNQVVAKEVKSQITQNEPLLVSGKWIKAPLVGTFYTKSNPEAKPYINVGQSVKKGQVLCLIEAMKVMNEIKADCNGVIKEIKGIEGKMVEFNQDIIFIEEEV
ncbi:MAG: acetyl-CoA carboxylase biotin carboxyl carrier protein [Erysipelotrichaceae bacterium]